MAPKSGAQQKSGRRKGRERLETGPTASSHAGPKQFKKVVKALRKLKKLYKKLLGTQELLVNSAKSTAKSLGHITAALWQLSRSTQNFDSSLSQIAKLLQQMAELEKSKDCAVAR